MFGISSFMSVISTVVSTTVSKASLEVTAFTQIVIVAVSSPE